MSQFTTSILECQKQLTRRFDQLLMLKNVNAQTLDRDAHYAIFRLAQSVATEFPSAELELFWVKEQLNYNLPGAWQTDQSPYWVVYCPSLTAPYDELLLADDAFISLGIEGGKLIVKREFIIDSVKATTSISADIPPEDLWLLRQIGKIQDELRPAYSSQYLAC